MLHVFVYSPAPVQLRREAAATLGALARSVLMPDPLGLPAGEGSTQPALVGAPVVTALSRLKPDMLQVSEPRLAHVSRSLCLDVLPGPT